jgi:hypothetical protein
MFIINLPLRLKSPSKKCWGFSVCPSGQDRCPRRARRRHVFELFRCGHFFGFAFLAHHFELTLGFFVGRLHFLLDALGRFFQLR